MSGFTLNGRRITIAVPGEPLAGAAEPPAETVERFRCFGGSCEVIVAGSSPQVRESVAQSKQEMLEWHERLSRFEPASELSRMNADPRDHLELSPTLAEFVATTIMVAELTGGLVDSTMVSELERAGYVTDLAGPPVSLEQALALAPARRPARPHPAARWRLVSVDGNRVSRPAGVRIDSGGLAKGMICDLLAVELAEHDAFAVNACGDVRVGGSARLARNVEVQSPFDGELLHTFALTDGAAATSGIGRRSWFDAGGRPAHHLLDPATGRPAFTGLVQVTALAPSALQAEALAKAALLSGPDGAAHWLTYGGVLVHEDRRIDVIAADRSLTDAARVS